MGMTPEAVRRLQRALAEEEEHRVSGAASREEARRAEADRLIRTRLVPVPPEVAAADPSRAVDEFVLVEELGRGGGGEVWKAWDRNLARWVALKRPAPGTDRRRFLQEALAAARLSHPAIVPVHRVVDRDPPYLVMDLVDGRNLAGVALEPAEAARVMAEVARAVAYAHAQGVVHRDLKPANLMLDPRGAPRILDFGIAGLGGAARPSGEISGTPEFMAPEQSEGGPAASAPAVDVYALGATLKALCGKRLPSNLTGVVERAMREVPAERTKSAGEFAKELSASHGLGRLWIEVVLSAGVLLVVGLVIWQAFYPSSSSRSREEEMWSSFVGILEPALQRHDPPPKLLAELVRICSEELQRRPDNPRYRSARGRVRLRQVVDGVDSTWEEAEADLQEAIRVDPGDWKGEAALGELLGRWGDSESRAGRDPGDRHDRALQAATRAARIAPDDGDVAALRGRIWMWKGEHLLRNRQDSADAFGKARSDFESALGLVTANRGRIHEWRAALTYAQADLEADKGGDPLPLYASAEADYAEALKHLPKPGPALLMRGCVRYNSAVHLKRAGKAEEAKRKAAAALEDFEAASKEDPGLRPQADEYAQAARRMAGE